MILQYLERMNETQSSRNLSCNTQNDNAQIEILSEQNIWLFTKRIVYHTIEGFRLNRI